MAGPTTNAISAIEVVRIYSMLSPLLKINSPKIEIIATMGGDE
jgi:hypothetical protein